MSKSVSHAVSTLDLYQSVKTWPSPKTITDVRRFMGTCSYYRRFIKDFAAIARPKHKLTEKNCPFKWTEECETAFEKLKITLITAPVLGFPDMSKHFLLDPDASGFGIGAVISQVTDGKEVVIAYFSKAQRQYCVTRRELLAVILGVKHFHHYLYGTRFIVHTNHGSLTWLLRFQILKDKWPGGSKCLIHTTSKLTIALVDNMVTLMVYLVANVFLATIAVDKTKRR